MVWRFKQYVSFEHESLDLRLLSSVILKTKNVFYVQDLSFISKHYNKKQKSG
ncbi:hypothetical protein IFVP177_C270165 [Vibrio parahaemolyticus]